MPLNGKSGNKGMERFERWLPYVVFLTAIIGLGAWLDSGLNRLDTSLNRLHNDISGLRDDFRADINGLRKDLKGLDDRVRKVEGATVKSGVWPS